MLARVLLRDNEVRDAELRERLADLRPLLLAGRAFAVVSFMLALLLLVDWVSAPPLVPVLLLSVAIVAEAQIVVVNSATSVASVDRRLVVVAFVFASGAGVVTFASGSQEFAGTLTFALVLAAAGTALQARPLAAVTLYSLLLFSVEAVGELAGWIPAEQSTGASESPISMTFAGGHAAAELTTLLVALFVFPMMAVMTFATTRRLVNARRETQAKVSELTLAEAMVNESRQQLEAWNEQLDEQVTSKTHELEEQNQHLAVINAVSFALSGRMDDGDAVLRAARLIARVVTARGAQLYIEPWRDHPARDVVVSADVTEEIAGIDPRLMREVAETGETVVYPSAGGDEAKEQAAKAAGVAAFAIVPLVAKGRTIGAFAALSEQRQAWDDSELHILVLIGREFGVALENARLYQDALESVEHETLLSDVVRVLGATDDAGRALAQALELVAARIGADVAAVATVGGAGLPEIMARYTRGSGADTRHGVVRQALLTAPSLVMDRTRPLVFGASGENTVSRALHDQGIENLVVAPIICADTTAVGDGSAHAATADRSAFRQTVAAALIVAAGPDVAWGQRQVDLLDRLSGILARRLETDTLLRLQDRRIRELSGLAEVAATVQSTIDPERLHSGFARAVDTLVSYQHIYIARLDDAGDLMQVARFGSGGRLLPPLPSEASDSRHAWFGERSVTQWSAKETEAPSFVSTSDRFGLVAPMRPKGQVLGAVVVTTREPPSREQMSLVMQAVEQLGLALDSAALYRQATERAARIQVLGNLAAIVASVVDLREAFDAFAEEVRWLIPFDRALMFLVDESADSMHSYATYPVDDRRAEGTLDPLADSLAAVAVDAAGPVVLSRSDGRYEGFDWSAFGDDVQELAAVPVLDGTVCTAVFALARVGAQTFRSEELTALEDVAGLLAVTIDRMRLYERAEYNARHDLLTGLPNQRYLDERLAELCAGLPDGGESAVLMIDLDELKTFNDTLGHEIGDQVLRIVARDIRAACRADDFVSRAGGDEFVIAMEGADATMATTVAARIHERLANSYTEVVGAPTLIRVSVGIAVAPHSGMTADELLHAADRAMYEAKFAGGGRTMVADPEATTSKYTRNRRAARVSEVLEHAATAGASEAELAALALAQRYAESLALEVGVQADESAPLRMLVAAEAAPRLRARERDSDNATAVMLLAGLRELGGERAPQIVAACAPVTSVAVELAWLQAPPPVGAGLVLNEALKQLHQTPPTDASEEAMRHIDDIARRKATEPRREDRAA